MKTWDGVGARKLIAEYRSVGLISDSQEEELSRLVAEDDPYFALELLLEFS